MITYKFVPEKLSGEIFKVELPLPSPTSSRLEPCVVPLELYIPHTQVRRGDLDALQERITKAVEKMVAELNIEQTQTEDPAEGPDSEPNPDSESETEVGPSAAPGADPDTNPDPE